MIDIILWGLLYFIKKTRFIRKVQPEPNNVNVAVVNYLKVGYRNLL